MPPPPQWGLAGLMWGGRLLLAPPAAAPGVDTEAGAQAAWPLPKEVSWASPNQEAPE